MKKILFYLGTTIIALVLLVATPIAFAQSDQSATSSKNIRAVTKLAATATHLQDRAKQEIDRRISKLGDLMSRVEEMKKVSTVNQGTLTTEVQGQINLLNNLETKINADTDETTLKSDIQSITKSYRTFALILPRIQILAAADRLSSTTDLLANFAGKLQIRLTEAQNAGNDISALQKTLADMNASITDAVTQGQNAVSGVLTLMPDNGDQSLMASNTTALKAARANLLKGTQDLKTAYKDALTIRLGLAKTEHTNDKTVSSTSTTAVTP